MALGESMLTTYCFRKSLEANHWMFICHLNRDAQEINRGRGEAQGLRPQLGRTPLPAPTV